MKKEPKIAVLLAAFNGLDYIEPQLHSILNQRGVQVDIFISVDLSSDDTYAWCLAFAGSHPNVAVLPYGARFGGAAGNFFRLMRDVDFSGFDTIAFSDQDDIWLPDKLARASTAMAEKNSHGYSSNVLAFWPGGAQRLIAKAQPQRRWDYLFEAAGPGCTYVLTLDLAAAIKQVVLAHPADIAAVGLHDWFAYAYARANGYAWFIDAWPGVLYRQHRANQIGANRGGAAFFYRVKKVLAGWGIEQAALIARLVGQSDAGLARGWRDFRRFGLLELALRAGACRRKPLERVWFFFACLLMALVGKRG